MWKMEGKGGWKGPLKMSSGPRRGANEEYASRWLQPRRRRAALSVASMPFPRSVTTDLASFTVACIVIAVAFVPIA
jgi:hypothetical protein